VKWPIGIKWPKVPSLMTPDGRKAWSFIALMGASVVFTLMASWAYWHVRTDIDSTFKLGLAAHLQLFAVIAVFGAQFVRRIIKAGKDGIEISDSLDAPAAAQLVADEAQIAADTIKDG